MFIKTKENEITRKQNNKRSIVTLLVIILLVMLVIIFLVSNKATVLDKVGKIFNINETNKTEEILNNETELQTLSVENWDLEKVNIVYDKDNVPVPVPKGYVASSVENGVTPIGQEILEENRVSTGFVIYEMTAEEIENGAEVNITKDNFWEESQKRNQWVWIPVADASRIYERNSSTGKAKAKLWNFTATGRTIYSNNNYEPGIVAKYDNEKYLSRYDLQGLTREQLLQELENEFEATMESIEKYGGFYIGRYEAGNVGSGSQSNHNTPRQPVIQRMNTNINYVTWYDAYNNMKNIQINENVKSNIIWGSLWDETLQWLVDSGDKSYTEIISSSDWGNYRNSNFYYTTVSGTIASKEVNNGTNVPTGSSEKNKAMNIYDMAGNMLEWTLEVYDDDYRRARGGSCNDTWCPVDFRNFASPDFNYTRYGVRAYLYIK